MKNISNKTFENKQNFHEVNKERKQLKQELEKLSVNSGKVKEGLGIFEAEYKKELEESEVRAKEFKIADFGTLSEAKKSVNVSKNRIRRKNFRRSCSN
ncbi:MAG: hypothetical protein V1910_01215 [bacterium]